MDSLKVSGMSFGSFGVWYLDVIPWALAVGMLFLNCVYLVYKIKKIKEL
tara:strand:+ start:172 stop:318 length:147 start_codon:yes stop_codon:yes gene_type:complete